MHPDAEADRQERRELPCQLTDKELDERRDHLAQLHGEEERLSREKKEALEDFKDSLSKNGSLQSSVAKQIRDRAEDRLVECRWMYNKTAKQMELLRSDTNDIVDKRDPRPDELQGRLWDEFLEGGEHPDEAAG